MAPEWVPSFNGESLPVQIQVVPLVLDTRNDQLVFIDSSQ